MEDPKVVHQGYFFSSSTPVTHILLTKLMIKVFIEMRMSLIKQNKGRVFLSIELTWRLKRNI